MATVPQVGAEGHAWSGIFASGHIPERFRKNDILSQMAFITRHNTPFLSMITQKFSKPTVKTKRVFESHELEELKRAFTVTVSSADTNHTQFGISNADAEELTTNDVLYFRDIYTTVTYQDMVGGQIVQSTGTNVGPNILTPMGGNPTGILFNNSFGFVNGNYFTNMEVAKIVSVGARDSAGAGNTLLTVRRCYYGPSGQDQGGAVLNQTFVNTAIQANPTGAGINVGFTFLRGLPAFKEGTGAPSGFFKNPVKDNNCTQEFKYAVEITKESNIDIQGLKDYEPLNMQRMLANRRITLDIERTMIFGRKGIEEDTGGKKSYTTGGVVEHIPKDANHIIKYKSPSLNYGGFLDIGYNILDLGGGAHRSCFIGVKLFNAIKKSFEGHQAFRFNKEDIKNYDFNIESLDVSGGTLDLIPLHCMDEFGWGDKMLALDLTVPSYVPVTHKDWDMKVETDIGEKGVQIYKEQIIGMKGLERRFAEYQSIVDFAGII